MVGGSGVCYVGVFSLCVFMVAGPLVWHGVDGGKGDGGATGLVCGEVVVWEIPLLPERLVDGEWLETGILSNQILGSKHSWKHGFGIGWVKVKVVGVWLGCCEVAGCEIRVLAQRRWWI